MKNEGDFLEELQENLCEEIEISSTMSNDTTNNNDVTNCLALTVVKDYKLTVFKNVLKKSCRISWKIALSIITMNFLNTFL